jgi:phage terminase large subunit-like protein
MRQIRRARRNVNAFISLCFTDPLGRRLRQGQVHRELQAFLGDHRKALVELPRDHGKSTQVCARIIWELGRDPSLRIKIVCGSDALAAERGRFVRLGIAHNERVQCVFPRLTPEQPWSDTRFTVRRPADMIGPSVTAIGVGAASTGARADLLICDDIVDVKSLSSAAERERVKNRFRENLMNLLEPDGRFWGLCTPWHNNDLNAELKKNESYPLFRRAISEELEPVWPERWPREALEARLAEIGVISFARGYRLYPITDDVCSIPASSVQYWDGREEEAVLTHADQIVLSIDPAISTKRTADRTAFVVLAKCGGEIRCIYSMALRVGLADAMKQIQSLDAVYKPQVILFESNGAFQAIAEDWKHGQPFGPRIKEVKQSKDKGVRVAAFSVPVENGRFLLKGDKTPDGTPPIRVHPAQQELFAEITSFPQGEHDDLLDAAAMGTAYLLGVTEPRVL